MDIFGIGGPELIAVLVVALLVLGPERMVDFARQAGKWWREAQLAVRAMADAATTKLDEERDEKPNMPPRDPVPEPEDAVARASAEEEVGASGTASSGPASEPEGTIARGSSGEGANVAAADGGVAPEQNETPRAG